VIRRRPIARILLVIEHRKDRQLLSDWLSVYHVVSEPLEGGSFEEPFDLCIVDGPNLSRCRTQLEKRREEELPGILPVLLITPRRDVWASTAGLWKLVDDAIAVPVSKLELQARVEILLRSRRMSQDLKLRNDDLEAFIQAMSHDLRASIRTVTMFTESLTQSQSEQLNDEGKSDLKRIEWAAQEMRDLIDSLLNFSKLGRGKIRTEPIDLRNYIEKCLRNLEAVIRDRNASVNIKGRARTVQADPTLMKIAITNLVSNAIKFVPQGVQPKITVSTSVRKDICRIQVDDNGVGIPREDQQRIFLPFVRLRSEEEFGGIGLGLPSVRKAAELMGGRVGVESTPGQGSRFWLEFSVA
jgi:signal transduction histidine kinase